MTLARILVLKALRCHGPLSDAQLAWWLGHCGIKSGSARRARHDLTRVGKVRFARKLAPGKQPGRWCQLWEVHNGS